MTEGFAIRFASYISLALLRSINLLKKLHWSFFFTCVALSGSNHSYFIHQKNTTLFCIVLFGGDRGIRTLAPLAGPNSLANCPLRPTWVCLLKNLADLCPLSIWRRGWDSNPRYAHTYANFQDWCLKPTRPPLRIMLYNYNTCFLYCQYRNSKKID